MRQLLKRQASSRSSWIVYGLGNPGSKYEKNRHNVGKSLIQEIASRSGKRLSRHRSGLEIAKLRVGKDNLLLATSPGFMNESGKALPSLLKIESIQPNRLIVIHDELDLPLGTVRAKFGGGHAGHNGIRDIMDKVGSEFHRVRIGIGRPPETQPVAAFVLSNFSNEEESAMLSAKELAESIIYELAQADS